MRPRTQQDIIRSAPVAEQLARTAPARGAARSPYTGKLPGYQIVPAFFHALTVPAGLSTSIPTGQQAAFGLRKIRFQRDMPEGYIVGYRAQMLPCDTAGSTLYGGAGLAWGDRRGLSAAIVIGRDLGIRDGAWSAMSAHIAGISANAASAPTQTTYSGAAGTPPLDRIICRFPTGGFGDTTPNWSNPARTFTPYVLPCPNGTSLDVAFVCDRAYVVAGAGTLYGLAEIELLFVPKDGSAGSQLTDL